MTQVNGHTTIKVLLVEDNAGDALLLRETLADTDAEIDWAHDRMLTDALNRLERERFDVVLLDLSLPDSQGIETFRKIQRRAPDAPVVMLTGLDDERVAAEAMQQGAQDYLVKGGTDGHALLRSMRYAIERTRRERAERELRMAHEDMNAARSIQQRLFPDKPPQIEGFDIGGASVPAGDTGGDYYDYIPMLGGALGLVVGDVSGHGFGPALLMANTRGPYLRALALTCSGVGDIFTRTNTALGEDTSDEHFVTLVLARLDPKKRSVVYASAGHNPIIVLSADGEVRRELTSTDLPLGIEPDTTFTAADPFTLERGEILFLFTDGLIEARAQDGNDFGLDRALETIRANRTRPASEIVTALHQAVRDFEGGESQRDDVTMVVVKVL